MKSIKTGFIKPTGETIFLDYYDVESYCRSEIHTYVQDKKNLDDFKKFSEEYTYFKPYLDFVLFSMRYIQINPFFMDGYIGYTDGDSYFVRPSPMGLCYDISKVGAFYFYRSCDFHFDIQNGAIIQNGMVDVKGNAISLFSDGDIDMNAWGHPGLSSMILNQFCSFSKTICEDFQAYFDERHPNMYTMYLMERLGFMQITNRRSHHFIFLNRGLTTKRQLDIAHFTEDYYGSSILPFGECDAGGKAKKLVKEIWGDVYENR